LADVVQNADKCKVFHFGYNNLNNIYSLGDKVINAENEEKGLGVIVSDTLKPSHHGSFHFMN